MTTWTQQHHAAARQARAFTDGWTGPGRPAPFAVAHCGKKIAFVVRFATEQLIHAAAAVADTGDQPQDSDQAMAVFEHRWTGPEHPGLPKAGLYRETDIGLTFVVRFSPEQFTYLEAMLKPA